MKSFSKRCLFTGLFILSSAFCANAQSQQVAINLTKAPLKQLFTSIEKQSPYRFSYRNATVSTDSQISFHTQRKMSIKEILKQTLPKYKLRYELDGNTILILKVKSSNQNIQVRGTVLDSDKMPLIGVSVTLSDDNSKGAISDIDGHFILQNVPTNAQLTVSYIGFKTQYLQVKRSLKVVMQEDTRTLDEVVVIGYGVQKKKDLTGSVANISAKDMTLESNTNIGQALQGKIAGVDIVSQGGAPGSGTRIMIRGIGTLNNNNPLYVVDGMYMDDIDNINPNDIKSIDVLKDASSAAIYGSRAANGVVIVTTKEGTNTEGVPTVDLSVNLGIQQPSKYLNMLNASQWAQVTTTARAAIGKNPLEMAQDLGNKEDNDWQDIMMNPVLVQNYNASIKGGGKNYKFYSGLGYYNQDGTVKGTNYERYTIQFKAQYKKKWFSAGNNMVVSYSNSRPLPSEGRGGLLGTILQSIPTLQQYDSNNIGGYGDMYGEVTNLSNPLGFMDPAISNRKNRTIKGYFNFFAQAEIMKGLKYKINLTPNFQNVRDMSYEAPFDYGLTANDISKLTEQQVTKRNILIENLLTFDRTFGDHKISALVGYTFQNDRYRLLSANGKAMSDGLMEIDAATQDRTNQGYSTESAMTSILGRIFYSYKNKYLVTATIRRDASSKFAKSNRKGDFPSISFGWNLSEERFMQQFDWLDQLKFRAGYGVLGNQEIGNYLFSSVVNTGINYPDGNGGLRQGAFPKNFASPNIKWEETKMTNVGIDLTALNNRLTLVMDYYIKNTNDILLTVPIPISSGGANDPLRNAGKIQNKGFEFNLGWRDRINNESNYSINFIGSSSKNEIKALGTGSQVIWSGSAFNSTNVCKSMVGYPIGGFWLIPSEGLFQSDEEAQTYTYDGKMIQPNAHAGDVCFKDVNNDGKINDDDRVYKGSPFPKFNASINFSGNYKQFDALIGIQGVFGNKIYNATRCSLSSVTKGTNFLESTINSWSTDNQNTDIPRLNWDDPNRNNRAESDRFLESGSYVRVRNIQLGYTFNNQWLKDNFNKLRIYLNVENPFIITNYSGYSPDVNGSDSKSRGFDYFTYPNNRTFMLGINMSF